MPRVLYFRISYEFLVFLLLQMRLFININYYAEGGKSQVNSSQQFASSEIVSLSEHLIKGNFQPEEWRLCKDFIKKSLLSTVEPKFNFMRPKRTGLYFTTDLVSLVFSWSAVISALFLRTFTRWTIPIMGYIQTHSRESWSSVGAKHFISPP